MDREHRHKRPVKAGHALTSRGAVWVLGSGIRLADLTLGGDVPDNEIHEVAAVRLRVVLGVEEHEDIAVLQAKPRLTLP
jgi:hypothetical protein